MRVPASWSPLSGNFFVCPESEPQRNDFLDSAQTYVDPSVPTILEGDFNLVFDRAVDRRGSCVDNDSRESCLS